MRWGWAAALAWVVAAGGCIDGVPVALPDVPPDVGTRVLVIRSGDLEEAWVVVPGQPETLPPDLAVGPGLRLYVYDYAQPPAVLGLTPGHRADDHGSTRVLPAADGFTGALEGSRVRWVAEADLEVLAEQHWPDVDWLACLELGGCGDREPMSESLHCTATCPATIPALPELARLPVVPDWPAVTVAPDVEAPSPGPPAVASCTGGEAVWFGKAECASVSTCAGPWPEPPSDVEQLLYVAEGGTGTGQNPSTPLGSLDAALTVAAPGAVILVSGQLTAPTGWPVSVTVQGACPEQAELVAVGPAPHLELDTAGVRLFGLTLPPLSVTASVSLGAARVVAAGPEPAIRVSTTGKLHAQRLLVDVVGTQGILLERGELDLGDAVVRGAQGNALDAVGGHVSLRQVRLVGTQGEANATADAALLCRGCALTAEDIETVENEVGGIWITEPDSQVDLRRPILRGSPDGVEASAVQLEAGLLTIREGYITGPTSNAIRVSGDGRAVLEDVSMVDMGVPEQTGRVLFLTHGATADLNRVLVVVDLNSAMYIDTTSTVAVTIRDLSVVSLATDSDDSLIDLEHGSFQLERISVRSETRSGLRAQAHPRVALTLQDLTIVGGGSGLKVSGGVSLVLTRAAILDTHSVGLRVGGGSNDLNMDTAVANDVTLHPAAGAPAVVRFNSTLELERFLIEGPAVAGIQAIANAQLRLKEGTLRDLDVGLSLQVGVPYDLEDLVERVAFERVTEPVANLAP